MALKALYGIVRTESLGVQNFSRHRSCWEPWRSKLFTPSFVLGALAFKAFHVIVRNGALAFRTPPVTGPSGGGDLGVKTVSVTGPSVGLRAHTTVRTGSLGVKSLSRHRKLLGALVFRAFYVTVRSWEPWCEELSTSQFALGSLSSQSSSNSSLVLGALAFKVFHVTVRSWQSLCSELFTSL